ncbi:MAG: hypothetical protein KDM63_03085 [Verrucomicrobiae bacterium]|nr:hypothetical protein [Verrucomicrobiae bacterium]
MKLCLAFLAIASLSVFSARADDVEIIYQASAKKNPFQAAVQAADILEARDYTSAVRVQHDANVYRFEGLATTRHDERSSYAIFFYVPIHDWTDIHLGNSFAR